jgi:amidase
MDPDELWSKPAGELARAIRAKEIGSRELLDVCLARIDRFNPGLNAVVTLDEGPAREAALVADEAVARDGDLGPLHGLPITVKDALETAGIRSTGGSTKLRDHVPSTDAPAVARVKAAGAIVFGKTNVPEWSGDSQTHNEIFGVTRNPRDESRSPGGSSGGPAVSVACGFSAFEIGTDIGGSIRMPASVTGICGHKPTFGIVPSRGYLDHVGGGLTEADINVLGPMARNVDDLSLLLGVLTSRASAGRGLELSPPRTTTRLGVWLDDPGCSVDHEVLGILESAVSKLEADGAQIETESRPVDFDESMRVFQTLLSAAIAPGLPDEIFEMAKSLDAVAWEAGEDPLIGMGRGVAIRHRDWILLDERRELLRRKWANWFENHDALLCPVGPLAAQPLSDVDVMTRTMSVNGVERSANDLILWPGLIGVVYLPSTVVPVGFTSGGLPVGIQVVGPHLGDLTSLSIAKRLESLTGGYTPPPLTTG